VEAADRFVWVGDNVMRFLLATLYIVLQAGRMWLGTRLQPAAVERITARVGNSRPLVVPSLGVALTVLAFLQFWVVAGYIPWLLVAVLAVINLILLAVTYILRALLGLDSTDQRRKEFCLSFVWGAIAGRSLAPVVAVLVISLFVWPAAVLWIFFSHYSDFHEKIVKLALFHFCAPAIAFQLLMCVATSGLLASAHVDDDVRNSNFFQNLNTCIIASVFVLYPAYLLSIGSAGVIVSLGGWVLLSTPTLIFIICTFVPFLAGSFRYGLEVKNRANWRRKWIEQMLDLAVTPSNRLADEERRRLIDGLNKEIENRLSENRVFEFLRGNLWEDQSRQSVPHSDAALPMITADVSTDGADTERVEALPQAAVGTFGRDDRSHTNPISPRLRFRSGRGIATAANILDEERASFIEWDVSFRNINELFALQRAARDLESNDFVAYLKSKAEGYARDSREERGSRKRNIIVSFIISLCTTGASTAIVQGFKSHERQILDFVGNLVAAGGW
jgi:hypothetical protein